MNTEIPNPPKEPPNLPEGFIPVVQDKPDPLYWSILLILGVIIHFSYAYALMTMKEPIIEWCIYKAFFATLGTVTFSMIFIPIIRKVTKTLDYFTKKNIAIALYVGFFFYLIFKDYGRRG